MVHPITPSSPPCRDLRLPCYLLDSHPVNVDFCGREDVLQLLADQLLPPANVVAATAGAAPRQFALCGFGGIGKTEIAREFARRHKRHFDAIFWVVPDESSKLDHQYQQISLALGLEDESECKSLVVSREIVKGWLSNPQLQLCASDEIGQPNHAISEATWLLIFDNADDPIMLADYWPQGSGSVLVTSRDPLAKTMFTSRSAGIDLGPLSQQDSLFLFNHLIADSTIQEENAARHITDALGGVPLAISQMAGIIRRHDLTLAEFLELFTDQEERAALYQTKFDSNLVTYRHSLSSVWAFEKLKPQARKLLELISFLDPDSVGEDLLMEMSAKLLCETPPFKRRNYIDARTDLMQSSLVRRDKQKQQISVHRIVQDAVFATLDIPNKRFMFDQIIRMLWANWPSAMPQPSKEPELPQPKSSGGRLHVKRWPVCASLYPHILRIHQLWATIPDLSETTSLLFAKLLTEAAWYQKERGRTKHFDGFCESAQSICEISTHADRDSVLADIFFCKGSIAMDTNDFETSRINKEHSFDLVSSICKTLEREDERLYLAFAERGISRIQDRRYEEGEADLKEALRIRKALGNYIPRSGEANLSWALLAQGKLDECNTLLLDSLAGREKALGKDDRESVRTGLILYALGNLRAAQRQWDESFEYHSMAWRHISPSTSNEQGDATKPLPSAMINLALQIWSVDQTAHRNEIARTTFLKGKVFEGAGKTQKAAIALKVACRLRKEITKVDRDAQSLTAEDFDEIVGFWAR
ncbi:tetratricopeptide repeat domain-containing protein [Cordyceps javanica]|uniref:Tetratricopeptide repeat domain-containing protein n=1 Tax=Cordyceps javanica TaxID=43265 RepID=A0A545USS6_9HYPO|nr:tetratricopeptide repeat domain-containing protein [Cordyceps javanica]